jgi:hypothetical protein
MKAASAGSDHESGSHAGLAVEPAFVLLFSVHLRRAFTGVGALPAGLAPLPADQSRTYVEQFSEFEARLLGKPFLEARRIARWPVGRIALDGMPQGAPDHGDVYLLSHKSGVALWEVWLPAPSQPFDAARWVDWLDPEDDDALVASLWRILGPINQEIAGTSTWSGLYFPLTLLRTLHHPLHAIVERYGPDLIHLLYLDRVRRSLKPSLVSEELARDYCTREGGMTLLGRRSGLDLHGREDLAEDRNASAVLPPHSALPFVITLELLLLERTVLQTLYGRLSRRMPRSVEELLTLKQDVIDGLEEYYGAITTATRFSDAVTADGERLLGVADLYDAVMNRLDAVSFAITTRYQNRLTLLQFWLTIVFGATEIGFSASTIATWYYRTELWAVLAWTLGAALASGAALTALLRGRVE